jgi:hypothetical protein
MNFKVSIAMTIGLEGAVAWIRAKPHRSLNDGRIAHK